MKKIFWITVIFIITACSIPVTPPPTTVATPTVQVVPSATPVVITPTFTPSSTPTPTATPLPTFTPTPSWPMFTVDTDSNCRSGPSKDYQILEGIYTGESVQILGQTTPERAKWWYVQKDGTNCWVSGILGVTSGNLLSVPFVAAPPIPTPTHTKVKVLFENNTSGDICRIDLYVGIDLIDRFKWDKGKFKNQGTDEYVYVAIGGYDLIEAYNCKQELVATLTNIVINADHDAFSIP